MAGSSMAFTYDQIGNQAIQRVFVDWVSDDTTGAVTGTTKKLSGELIKATIDPGTPAPTTLYDIVITDDESFNVLTNCTLSLLNRHATATEEVYFVVTDGTTTVALRPVVCSALTIAITNAGNSKAGQIILFLRNT